MTFYDLHQPLVEDLRQRVHSGEMTERSLARITLPIWLYVVVTGWMIYMMLYQLD